MSVSKEKSQHRKSRRKALLAVAVAGNLGFAMQDAMAFQFATEDSDLKVTWDNTFKYNAAWRLKDADPALTTASTNNATNARNYNDGDLNFKNKGQISNRISLLSEFDLQYRNMGFRVSGSAWQDDAYTGSTDNPGGSVNSLKGASYNQFNNGTVNIHGRRSEILDAFAFGKFDIDGHDASFRAGKHGLVWGETLFFGANGIAGTMAATDVGKLQSVPGTTFKEAILPVNQVSGQVRVNDNVTVGAFYQLEWRANRLAGSGSYFSASDATGPGAETLQVTPAASWLHGTDVTPGDKGQGGVQLRFRLPEGETDYGLYYVHYHDKGFAGLITRGLPLNMPAVPGFLTSANANYQLIYGKDIDSYGASFSKTYDDVNVSGEVSARRNVPLVSYNMSVPLTGTVSNDPGSATEAVGNSAHVNLNAIWTLQPNALFQESSLVGEVAWNRRTSIVRNGDKLDPNTERDAWGWRLLFTPTYRQVLPGVDIGVPIGISYNPHGKSSVVSVFNNHGIDKGGDFSIGLDGSYLDAWRFTLTYARWFGHKGLFQDGLNGTTTQVKTFQNYLADRDFISFSLRRSF